MKTDDLWTTVEDNGPERGDFRGSRRRFLRATATAGVGGLMTSLADVARAQETAAPQEGVFELGDMPLRMGGTLRDAKLAYKTHGRLNADKSNAIVYPTPYSAQHGDVEWLIGRGKPLDPDKYFIIVPDQFGNGLSSSPSNTPSPQDHARFPAITNQDNVAAQHRLVTGRFGISRIALVIGWSMGAQQAFQWAVSHSDMVERMLSSCGTAKTTPHNAVFLESLRATLTLDPAWKGGDYEAAPVAGVKAFARIYAGWGFSQPFYKQALNRQLGFATLEDFLAGFWEKRFLRRDANNLLSMLNTWRLNDVGATPGFDGSLARALGSIKARSTVLVGQTDLYFPPDDLAEEAAMIPGAKFTIIPSIWGHQAGNGLNPADTQFVFDQVNELLAS
ncbi:MAG TPA: alpha/beta fold hydrolase [Burkholderiales bacterium]|nr:alpha/beta fold hydrolase [Burkholderiales bacterium]